MICPRSKVMPDGDEDSEGDTEEDPEEGGVGSSVIATSVASEP
ncbi:MAG: hypothetical protein AAF267_11545 [Deinococcota bacterium]